MPPLEPFTIDMQHNPVGMLCAQQIGDLPQDIAFTDSGKLPYALIPPSLSMMDKKQKINILSIIMDNSNIFYVMSIILDTITDARADRRNLLLK